MDTRRPPSAVADATQIIGKIGRSVRVQDGYSPWLAFPAGANVGNLGGGFRVLQYTRKGLLVILRGVGITSAAGITTLGTLPTGFRPSAQEIFTVMTGSGPVRVDVTTGGVVSVQGTSLGNAVFFSLSGISFYAD